MASEQTDDLSLSIAIDDDLIAAALASVDKKPAPPAEPDDVDVADDDEIDFGDLDIDLDLDIELEDDDDDASAALQEELAAMRAELAAAGEQIKSLRTDRERAGAHIKKLRKEVVRLRTHGQRTKERLDQLEDNRKRLDEARNSADAQVKHLQETHHRAVQQLKHLQERRRQEKEELRRFGHSKAVLALLPVIDNLQLAIQHAGAKPEVILSGVQMVLSQFNSALSSVGVTQIASSPGTRFKPEVHEAMLHVPTDDVQPGYICQEIAAGYVLHGRLLRAARVAVAAPPPEPPPAPEPEAEAEDAVALVEEPLGDEEEELFSVPEELAMPDPPEEADQVEPASDEEADAAPTQADAPAEE